jgi:prepilin-type N-terminal cleavage/methylation domain-containing protein
MREPARKTSGFTLIEIMIVAGIAALVMATAVPFAWHLLRKDPLRQAVSDIVEACSHARARAIFSGLPAELRISPPQRSLQVVAGSRSGDEHQNPADSDAPEIKQPVPAQSANFSAQLGEDLVIEELAVNFLPFKDAEEARVRFYPNGTSDEFTIVLQFPEKGQWRKISLEIVTGLAEVQTLEGRVWK